MARGGALRYSISDVVIAVKVPFRGGVHRRNLHAYHYLTATTAKGPSNNGQQGRIVLQCGDISRARSFDPAAASPTVDCLTAPTSPSTFKSVRVSRNIPLTRRAEIVNSPGYVVIIRELTTNNGPLVGHSYNREIYTRFISKA